MIYTKILFLHFLVMCFVSFRAFSISENKVVLSKEVWLKYTFARAAHGCLRSGVIKH